MGIKVLLIRRADTGRWAIPGGKLDLGETVAQCGVREVKEETGVAIEITGLVGIFSDPNHLIAYTKGGTVKEVRQPVNVCLHARPVGGELTPAPDEVLEARWVAPDGLDGYDIHPAIRLRITQGLQPESTAPYIG